MVNLTAAAIAKLAFDGVIQAGAGKLTDTAINQAKLLWEKIRDKFKEEPSAEKALIETEEQRSPEILEQQVVPFLHVAMVKDPQFAQEIQNIAQEINQEIGANSQDEFQMEAQGYDQSTVKQVGKIQADNVSF